MTLSKQKHPYHLLELSPLPILTAFILGFLMLGLVMYLHNYKFWEYVLFSSIMGVVICVYSWWQNVIKEGKKKHHTRFVQDGLKIGMVLFIISEVMFFFAFFFSYFYASWFPSGIADGLWVISDGMWPPKGIKTFDPWDIPFLNTVILLLSGTTVTWAHYAIEQQDQKNSINALTITILLGFSFSCLQLYEYMHAEFGLTDGVYAANFYLATGFHGIHVIIGTIFLFICLLRAIRGDFIKGGYLGFEFAAWYWHFVDIVWLFLFIFVYVFGR